MKKIISLLLCMVLVCCMGFTSMAQTNDAGAHYMTDYENLGELFEDLEKEAFDALDDAAKEQLYNTSIESVLASEENIENSIEPRDTAATFSGSLSTTALLKGRLTYKAKAVASTTATSIAISGLVYDSSGKIVDTASQTEKNVSSSTLSKTVTGLNSGEQHKVYVIYTAKFPSGVTPTSSTKNKTAYVDVK